MIVEKDFTLSQYLTKHDCMTLYYLKNITCLWKMSKSINRRVRKEGRAYRNSPAGYFSEGARLQRWHFSKDRKEQNINDLSLRPLRNP
jgi:hypothetical protein